MCGDICYNIPKKYSHKIPNANTLRRVPRLVQLVPLAFMNSIGSCDDDRDRWWWL